MSKKFTDEFFEKYSKYLKTEHWRNKREAVFGYKGRICTAQLEGCTGNAVEVHHTKDGYKLAFDTPLFELEPVCKSCHKKITIAHRTAKQRRADLTAVWHERLK